MWRATLVVGAACAFLAPIPQHKSGLRQAEPRWVDGPTDIGEAGAMSRHTGGAVCVLYFNPMGEGGAAALSTVEFAGQALPQCEFLLASQDRDKECWGAFDALPEGQALPCVEVFDGGTSQGIVAAGDLIATLASLGYKPGTGAAPTQGSVDSDKFFNLADDLWWRSAESRNAPRPKTPPPTNRRQEQRQQARAPRTTQRFIPGSGMGQAPPPGMGDEIKRQQDLEKQLGGSLPPGGRVVEGDDGQRKPPPPKKKGPDPIKDLKKKMDGFARELGKDTEAVRKKLSEQAREAQVSAQKAADDAVRAAGGETKRDKLERLFASDAEEVPTDENLSKFERFLENRRKGGTDADFYAAKEAKKDDDEDWLGEIKYKPPK